MQSDRFGTRRHRQVPSPRAGVQEAQLDMRVRGCMAAVHGHNCIRSQRTGLSGGDMKKWGAKGCPAAP